VGDAVFELMVRTWLCAGGVSTAKRLHNRTVLFVSAKSQAAAADRILPELCEEEAAVYRRGRNMHSNSVPKSSTHEQYHAATGIEALFGYLYLSGKVERLNELFEMIVSEESNNAT
jgi:ribonuclease-3 family protein